MEVLSVCVFHRLLGTKTKHSEQFASFLLTQLEVRGVDTSVVPHGGDVCMFESEVMVNSRHSNNSLQRSSF